MQHYAREAGPLAERAARKAIADSEVRPRDLTHLITVSCTGFHAPGLDVELIKRLHLQATIERTHIGFMGCHGALNGLRVARALADSMPGARVLLCAVELCSLHYDYRWNPKKLVANALFADGAAALVGCHGDGAVAGAWQAVASGSCLFPHTESAMTWTVADHGFDMTLSTRVPELITGNLRAFVDNWLDQNGLHRKDVASWAIHPGGPRIVSAAEEALDLDEQAAAVSREVLADCGNMSSPTVLFVLERLRERRAPRPCVALGFGPGLTVEVTLFQ
jgi:predicted naringenin-chalcone synthase